MKLNSNFSQKKCSLLESGQTEEENQPEPKKLRDCTTFKNIVITILCLKLIFLAGIKLYVSPIYIPIEIQPAQVGETNPTFFSNDYNAEIELFNGKKTPLLEKRVTRQVIPADNSSAWMEQKLLNEIINSEASNYAQKSGGWSELSQDNVAKLFDNVMRLSAAYVQENETEPVLTLEEAREKAQLLNWTLNKIIPDGDDLWNYEFTYNSDLPENQALMRWREIANQVLNWKRRSIKEDQLAMRAVLDNNDDPEALIEVKKTYDTAMEYMANKTELPEPLSSKLDSINSRHESFKNESFEDRYEGYRIMLNLHIQMVSLTHDETTVDVDLLGVPFISNFMNLIDHTPNGNHVGFLQKMKIYGRALELKNVDEIGNELTTDSKVPGIFLVRSSPPETPASQRLRRTLNESLRLLTKIEKGHGRL